MRNERLMNQMELVGTTCLALATAVQVDPKTVDRWVNEGRLPHRRHRQRAARTLGTTESELWPELQAQQVSRPESDAGLLHMYRSRDHVPPDLWRQLATTATAAVDVLVYSGLFFLDSHPELLRQPEAGHELPEVRVLVARSDSTAAAERAEEEGDDAHLATRIELSRATLRGAASCRHVQVREHDTTLYNSIYRFDDVMLVNSHTFGSRAPSNPVLYIRKAPHHPEDGLFGHYLQSFERVWEGAAPLATDHVA